MENKPRKPLSNTLIAIIAAIIVGPLWFGFVGGLFFLIDEVSGYEERYEGPDWIPHAIAIAILGIGFFLWRVVGSLIAARWGEASKETKDTDKHNT
ncbi:MAG: hypothetical protein ACYTEQ_13165 [Planctomycetota bacterium]